MEVYSFNSAVVVVSEQDNKTKSVYITRPFNSIPNRSQSDFVQFIDNCMSACTREKKKDKDWNPVNGINNLLSLEVSDKSMRFFFKIKKSGIMQTLLNEDLLEFLPIFRESRIFMLDFSNKDYYHAFQHM